MSARERGGSGIQRLFGVKVCRTVAKYVWSHHLPQPYVHRTFSQQSAPNSFNQANILGWVGLGAWQARGRASAALGQRAPVPNPSSQSQSLVVDDQPRGGRRVYFSTSYIQSRLLVRRRVVNSCLTGVDVLPLFFLSFLSCLADRHRPCSSHRTLVGWKQSPRSGNARRKGPGKHRRQALFLSLPFVACRGEQQKQLHPRRRACLRNTSTGRSLRDAAFNLSQSQGRARALLFRIRSAGKRNFE